MKNDREIEKLVGEVLETAREIASVQTDPHFLTRVRSRLRQKQESVAPTLWAFRPVPAWALPLVFFVLLLDAAALVLAYRTPADAVSESGLNQFAAYYSLSTDPAARNVYDLLGEE
ncbi:MAG: hypothetical protein HYX75_13420 [Acidobacteria bacterium]|nr:hypothetical protein [Acidobacteriota bacterium]